MGQESLRTALQDPHKLPEDPERPQEASKKPPRGSQEVTRRPQDGPQGLPRGSQETEIDQQLFVVSIDLLFHIFVPDGLLRPQDGA